LDCQDVLKYSSMDKAKMESEVNDDASYFSLVTAAYKSDADNFLKQHKYQGLYTCGRANQGQSGCCGTVWDCQIMIAST
jgi:hypothetical protein